MLVVVLDGGHEDVPDAQLVGEHAARHEPAAGDDEQHVVLASDLLGEVRDHRREVLPGDVVLLGRRHGDRVAPRLGLDRPHRACTVLGAWSGRQSGLAEEQVVLPDVIVHLQCDVIAGSGPLDMAVIHLHRHDRLHEIGRVAADVDALADSERLMERDGRHREMGEVVRDRADRVGRVVVLAHGKPP